MAVRAVVVGRKIGGTLAASFALALVSAAPWLVFGPLTSCMAFQAIRCVRSGRSLRGLAWMGANLALLLAVPVLTAVMSPPISA
jgi:hypothetical protein